MYNKFMTDDEYKSLEVDAASLYLLRRQKETLHQRVSDFLRIIIISVPILITFIIYLIFN